MSLFSDFEVLKLNISLSDCLTFNFFSKIGFSFFCRSVVSALSRLSDLKPDVVVEVVGVASRFPWLIIEHRILLAWHFAEIRRVPEHFGDYVLEAGLESVEGSVFLAVRAAALPVMNCCCKRSRIWQT